MNTKIVMTISAIFMGIIGIGLSFLPKEILTYLQLESNQSTGLILQLLGALYLGFGMMNWMAKSSIIGGIYNKPMVIGNLMHFGIGAITLLKIVFNVQENKTVIISLTIVYTILALLFGYVFMKNPSKTTN